MRPEASGCTVFGVLVIDGSGGFSLSSSFELFFYSIDDCCLNSLFPQKLQNADFVILSFLLYLLAGIPQRTTSPYQLFGYFEMQFIQETQDRCFCLFDSFWSKLHSVVMRLSSMHNFLCICVSILSCHYFCSFCPIISQGVPSSHLYREDKFVVFLRCSNKRCLQANFSFLLKHQNQ